MENGATINLESSWALNMVDEIEAVTTICGDKAGADMKGGNLRLNGAMNGRLYEENINLAQGGVDYFPGQKSARPEDREAAQWIDSIINDHAPTVLPEQAFVVTQILEGIYESAKTGKQVMLG